MTNNWIPLGFSTIASHSDAYNGGKIFGRVWQLPDYDCSNGVIRSELFVHSEETPSQGQTNCGLNGDSPKALTTSTRMGA